jgi:hypothetical protein
VRKIPPLILTQILFAKGMKGRFGTGQENDTFQERQAEFFGDIQVLRAEVPNEGVAFDPDKPLPKDGFFLTSQILRVISEPAPAGSPPSTPNRNFLRAWDNAYVTSADSALQADVITYDSRSNLILAQGEEGRGVTFAQQKGLGQPSSPGSASAVEFNPKTGAGWAPNSDVIQFFDAKTGTRPQHVPPPDPNAKPTKKPKQPFRVPNNNYERRGFTGQ